MKVIFLGTPEFAVRSLDSLVNSAHEVVAVVTQPDRINGRGNKITFSPVKIYAEAHGIPVYQFANISLEGEEILRNIGADVMVTAAYGQILKSNILDLCPNGILNVHASLLPKYRGSSPVQTAIIDGETYLGVTIMRTELGVDTGDILISDGMEITDGNSSEALDRLSVLGARLIVEALDRIADGTATFTKQDENAATHCRMFRKEDGLIDFSLPARAVVNRVRGLNPWPGAYTYCEHGLIKILSAKLCDMRGKSGEILVADKRGLIVACGEGSVEILRVKPDNGKEMDAKAYLLGRKLTVGRILGEQ